MTRWVPHAGYNRFFTDIIATMQEIGTEPMSSHTAKVIRSEFAAVDPFA
jgi:hypothetical protein